MVCAVEWLCDVSVQGQKGKGKYWPKILLQLVSAPNWYLHYWSTFWLSVVKPKSKQSQQPIRRKEILLRANESANKKQPKARENTGDQVVIGFSFASDWLRKWREFSEPIIERSKGKLKQSRITFDTQFGNRSYTNIIAVSVTTLFQYWWHPIVPWTLPNNCDQEEAFVGQGFLIEFTTSYTEKLKNASE